MFWILGYLEWVKMQQIFNFLAVEWLSDQALDVVNCVFWIPANLLPSCITNQLAIVCESNV